jgi:glutamate-1-semialdehyde aminotransferase
VHHHLEEKFTDPTASPKTVSRKLTGDLVVSKEAIGAGVSLGAFFGAEEEWGEEVKTLGRGVIDDDATAGDPTQLAHELAPCIDMGEETKTDDDIERLIGVGQF